ncbi:MAG: ABC transporter permease, partial [Pseudomonadota bacterium]
MSPITRRRIAAFRANRRARVSLWLFSALFVFSLFAELVANDKPLILKFEGEWYLPLVV